MLDVFNLYAVQSCDYDYIMLRKVHSNRWALLLAVFYYYSKMKN